MVNWGKDLKDIKKQEHIKFKGGGYLLRCIQIEDKVSQAGNKQFVLTFKPTWCVDHGNQTEELFKYDLKYYLPYELETHLPRVKGMLTSFQESNPAKLKPEDVESAEFDENRLINLTVGAVLREEEYLKDGIEPRSSLKIFYLCSKERIQKGEYEIPKPYTLEMQMSKKKTNYVKAENKSDDDGEIPF